MKSQVLQPIPYLLFDGNCLEAMEFYAVALGGKIISKMSMNDFPGAPAPVPGQSVRMIHVRLGFPGGGELYAGDCQENGTVPDLSSYDIALRYPTSEEAQTVFDALAEGGEVEMPMSPSFWSDTFGMLKCRFGVSWMINGNPHYVEG